MAKKMKTKKNQAMKKQMNKFLRLKKRLILKTKLTNDLRVDLRKYSIRFSKKHLIWLN
jgi:hypothetical protein